MVDYSKWDKLAAEYDDDGGDTRKQWMSKWDVMNQEQEQQWGGEEGAGRGGKDLRNQLGLPPEEGEAAAAAAAGRGGGGNNSESTEAILKMPAVQKAMRGDKAPTEREMDAHVRALEDEEDKGGLPDSAYMRLHLPPFDAVGPEHEALRSKSLNHWLIALEDDSPLAKAKVLGLLNEPQLMSVLLKMLEHPQPSIPALSAEVIGRLPAWFLRFGDKRGLYALLERFEESSLLAETARIISSDSAPISTKLPLMLAIQSALIFRPQSMTPKNGDESPALSLAAALVSACSVSEDAFVSQLREHGVLALMPLQANQLSTDEAVMHVPRLIEMLRDNALLTVCQLCCLRHIPLPPPPSDPPGFITASERAVAATASNLLAVAESLLGEDSAGKGELLEAAAFLVSSVCRHPRSYDSAILWPALSSEAGLASDDVVDQPSLSGAGALQRAHPALISRLITILRDVLALSRVPPLGGSAALPVGEGQEEWFKGLRAAFDQVRGDEPQEDKDEVWGSYVVELQCACLGVLDALCSCLLPGGGDAAANAATIVKEGGVHAIAAAYALCEALEGRVEIQDPHGHPAPTWWVKGYTELTLKSEKLKVGHCTGKPTETAMACLCLVERLMGIDIACEGEHAGWAVTHLVNSAACCEEVGEARIDVGAGKTAASRLSSHVALKLKERGNQKMKGGEEGYESARFMYSLALLLCCPGGGGSTEVPPLAVTLLGNRAEVCLRLGRGADAVVDATAACQGGKGGEKNERRLERAVDMKEVQDFNMEMKGRPE